MIDCSKCIIQGEVNNDHLFETFGHFSDESSESVRMDIIKCIESGKRYMKMWDLNFLNSDIGAYRSGPWRYVVSFIMVMNC